MRLETRIRELIREYGSERSAAEAVGIQWAYLNKLKRGLIDKPSEDTLEKLGLERVVSYRRIR